ncbi:MULTISPECIES: acyl-CoA dehydrogenase family protein [unclassified Minwuia]|jgi:acyl-CoA dehydrogenase|uniref:acyl-CoA dehydrogenase family protein n=1 Tax=unclassified Minwuia TaxID=2618799 RepID=UPI002478890C|nr:MULTISPECIES: acyl-CoA dehydrogenase family protein [unclassified Minwuia]
MDFRMTEEQEAIRDAVRKACEPFDDAYWLDRDETGKFPHEFHKAMADGGWLGIAMPEEYGGSGLGVKEAAIMMNTIAQTPGAQSAASAVHINIFGPHPIVVMGTEEQKQRHLPPLIKGEQITCFGVTEPDAGLDTTSIKTKAERTDKGYVVHGRKMWTSTAQEANKILLLARTTAKEDCSKSTDGISLFYTDFNRDYIEARVIPKMGRKSVDSNAVFIDGLPIPKEDLIGEEGKGFYYLLHSLNPERILVGIEGIGIGQQALERAVEYAKERVVFGRPIGMNQSIQHPLAVNWAELEAAYMMCMKAADLYDRGLPCGAEANAAKYLGAEAGFKAATQAVLTHGGMGYAKEYHVERLMREVMISRIAPVSMQMILNFIAERKLGLPRSY